MARGDAVAKGTAAERILKDPLFQEAHEALERQLVKSLKSIPRDGSEEATRLRLEYCDLLCAHDAMRKMLVEYMEHGKAEDRRLEAVANRPEPVKDPRWR